MEKICSLGVGLQDLLLEFNNTKEEENTLLSLTLSSVKMSWSRNCSEIIHLVHDKNAEKQLA